MRSRQRRENLFLTSKNEYKMEWCSKNWCCSPAIEMARERKRSKNFVASQWWWWNNMDSLCSRKTQLQWLPAVKLSERVKQINARNKVAKLNSLMTKWVNFFPLPEQNCHQIRVNMWMQQRRQQQHCSLQPWQNVLRMAVACVWLLNKTDQVRMWAKKNQLTRGKKRLEKCWMGPHESGERISNWSDWYKKRVHGEKKRWKYTSIKSKKGL